MSPRKRTQIWKWQYPVQALQSTFSLRGFRHRCRLHHLMSLDVLKRRPHRHRGVVNIIQLSSSSSSSSSNSLSSFGFIIVVIISVVFAVIGRREFSKHEAALCVSSSEVHQISELSRPHEKLCAQLQTLWDHITTLKDGRGSPFSENFEPLSTRHYVS